MSENSLAFSVAQIRSFENNLLNRSHFEQILSAANDRDVLDLLAAHGYEITEGAEDINGVLDFNLEKDFELIGSLSGGAPEIRIFTLKNDYHNLKTAIKGYYGSVEADGNMLSPATVDIKTLKTAVSEKKYDLLPGLMPQAAAEAYEALVTSGDGQTADIIIDRYTLEEYLLAADNTDSRVIKEYCFLTVAAADIKTAFRGAKTGKGEDFYEKALCGTDELDKRLLSRAARKGEDEVTSFISSAGYSDAAAALKNSVYEFEKWYNLQALSVMEEAMFESFSIEPLIAYAFKRENEIKNIRIAVTCKNMGLADKATERMCLNDV